MARMFIPSDLRGITYEQEEAFGADPAGTKTSLRATDIEFTPEMNKLFPAFTKNDSIPRGADFGYNGCRGGKLKFKIPLRSELISTHSDFFRLASCCGCTGTSITTGSGNNLVTGGGDATLTVADANEAWINKNAPIILRKGSTFQIRHCVGKSSNLGTTTANIGVNWGDNPTNGDELTPYDWLVPAYGPSPSLTFYVYEGGGAENYHHWKLMGCCGIWKIPPCKGGEIPFVEFEFNVANWSVGDTVPVTAVEQLNPPWPLHGDPFYIDNDRVQIASFGFDPGLKISPVISTYGVQGKENWIYGTPEPKIEIEPTFDPTFVTAYEGSTDYNLFFYSAASYERWWSLNIPSAQIVKHEMANGSFGYRTSKMEWKVLDPGLSTEGGVTATSLATWCFGISGYYAA